MPDPTPALAALEAQVRADIATLSYPSRDWVEPVRHTSGQHVYDVVIVGAGQSGLAAGFALKRDGVSNVLLIDRADEGREGVWENFGRMETLRTPKMLVGLEGGFPSLSAERWYGATYGADAWDAIDRVGRRDWAAYLRWLRTMFGLQIRNGAALTSIVPDGEVFALSLDTQHGADTVLARYIVLATGYDGGGEWRLPAHVAHSVPKDRVFHSNGPIDFAPMAGKRVGILGHGASAFDAACTALDGGARTVDLCFRRPKMPQVNPHRWVEFAGFLKHFPDLSDRTRWNVNRHFKRIDQPPAHRSFIKAHATPGFSIHPGTSWDTIATEDDEIVVRANGCEHRFDYAICATGSALDLAHRPELRPFAGEIARWQDRYIPEPDESHPALGAFPYLDPHYAFQEREPGAAPYLSRIAAFNFSAIVSMGPHSTSVSGHKYSVPRLVAGLTRRLFLDQDGWVMNALEAYDECDLPRVEALKAAG